MSAPVEIRPVQKQSDHDALLWVWKNVYGVDEILNSEIEEITHYLGWLDGRPVFGASVETFDCLVRGQVFKTAAIAMVAVPGVERSSGVGTAAMNALVQSLSESEFELAALYGFRDPFYRKSGFASCGWRWRYSVRSERMPKLNQVLECREVPLGELHVLADCYREFIRNFSGSMIRNERQWRHRLGKNPPTIYAFGDPVESYFWCDLPGFWDDLEIGEFAWSSSRGYESGLALMRSLAINKARVCWNEPAMEVFSSQFYDEGVQMERYRPTMFRFLLGNGTQLKLESFISDGVTLRVSESGVETPIELSLQGGGKPVELSIQHLTQAVMGNPGVEALTNLDKISGDQEAIEVMRKSLPAEPVTLMEFF